MVNEAFLLREDIDNEWLFAANVKFEDDTHDIAIKCKSFLTELWNFQLHALMVKLGRAVNPHDDNGDVKKVMHTTISNGTYLYIFALDYFFLLFCLPCS